MVPVTKEDFENFEKELAEKVTGFSSSEYYPEFVEKLVRRLCVDRKFCLPFFINGIEQPRKSFTIFAVPAPAIKNIKKNVEAAHTAKLKEEQAAKTKKGKGKGASLKMGTDKVAVTLTKLPNFKISLSFASRFPNNIPIQLHRLRGCRICFRAKPKAATTTWTTSCDIKNE